MDNIMDYEEEIKEKKKLRELLRPGEGIVRVTVGNECTLYLLYALTSQGRIFATTEDNKGDWEELE